MLSVCIITKNEEKNLKKCLESIKPLGFEIIVADTGSSDGTMAIAREFADHVYTFAWCDDFAKAKNFAISKANNDMVLVLDSDEEVVEADLRLLEEQISKYRSGVGRIKRYNQFDRDGANTENVEWINRIFSKSRYCYRGRIHEQVVPVEAYGNETMGEETYPTYRAALGILHCGYCGTPEEMEQKAKRNIRLLLEEQKKFPEDPYIIYQLGKSWYMAKDYQKAVEYFEEATSFDLNPRLEYVIDLVETYGYALLKAGQTEKALQFENLIEEFGDSADFAFLMGHIYMNNSSFEKAVDSFLRAASYGDARVTGSNSYLAYYNAGVIKECLGQKEEAERFYCRCKDYLPAKERLEQMKDGI